MYTLFSFHGKNYVLTMVCTNLETVRISRCLEILLIDQCLARQTWFLNPLAFPSQSTRRGAAGISPEIQGRDRGEP